MDSHAWLRISDPENNSDVANSKCPFAVQCMNTTESAQSPYF